MTKSILQVFTFSILFGMSLSCFSNKDASPLIVGFNHVGISTSDLQKLPTMEYMGIDSKKVKKWTYTDAEIADMTKGVRDEMQKISKKIKVESVVVNENRRATFVMISKRSKKSYAQAADNKSKNKKHKPTKSDEKKEIEAAIISYTCEKWRHLEITEVVWQLFYPQNRVITEYFYLDTCVQNKRT